MSSAFAVFIGINRYKDSKYLLDLQFAEKDCHDMRDALCTHSHGLFNKNNTLVLAGAEATTDAIESTLYQHVVKDRSADDLVIVYFSGHGFIATDEYIPYIASYDVSMMELHRNPSKGLSMERLHSEYFRKSPARHLLLMLDCCHSGSISPGGQRDSHAKHGYGSLIPPSLMSNNRGRMALVSCPPESISRESPELKNGMFTHYLVRGLRGDAAEPDTTEVTVDSLLAYTRRSMPPEQPPGSFGELYGRLVLTKPRRPHGAPLHEGLVHQRSDHVEELALQQLAAPLDAYSPMITRLVGLVQDGHTDGYADERVLGAILQLAQGDIGAVVRVESDVCTTVRRLIPRRDDSATKRRADRALARAFDGIHMVMRSKSEYHNVMFRLDQDEGNAWVVIACVPGNHESGREFLVISGTEPSSPALDDVFMHIVVAMYLASNRLTTVRPELLEASIFDHLKRHFYQHMPIGWYRRRFELFQQRLRHVALHFQPVLCLQPKSLYISAWEALARDAETRTAPVDIFEAAEIWGTRFVTELDLHCAETAIRSYVDALREARMQRPHEMPELCVNVYPSTVMRSAFLRRLGELLDEFPLRRRLILEISEKLPLPAEAADLASFRSRLETYVRQLEVSFAIDDFGVGYSSVERLAHLAPSYVKIDREVLHLQTGDHAIRYVLDVTSSKRLSPAKVVVEGFDGDSDLSLARLYALGVRYVQGFTIGKAGPSLYRIKKEDAKYLEALLVDRPAARA